MIDDMDMAGWQIELGILATDQCGDGCLAITVRQMIRIKMSIKLVRLIFIHNMLPVKTVSVP